MHNIFKIYIGGCGNVFKDNFCSNLGSKLGKCVQLKSVTACQDNQDMNNITL